MEEVSKEQERKEWTIEIEDPENWISKTQKKKMRVWLRNRLNRYYTKTSDKEETFEESLQMGEEQELFQTLYFESEENSYGKLHWRVLETPTTGIWQIFFSRRVPSLMEQLEKQKNERHEQLRKKLRERLYEKRTGRQAHQSKEEMMYQQLRTQNPSPQFREWLPKPSKIQQDVALYSEIFHHIPTSAVLLRNYFRECLGSLLVPQSRYSSEYVSSLLGQNTPLSSS